MTSRFHGQWLPRREGPLSLAGAKAFVRSRGVVIPRYLFWFVPEDEGLTLDECGLADADARYYRIDQNPGDAGSPIFWDQFLTKRGRLTVSIRKEILRSEEHCLYVFAHETFEIQELKRTFARNKGAITFRQLCYLISPEFHGAIHEKAVLHGDTLVDRLRKEREVWP